MNEKEKLAELLRALYEMDYEFIEMAEKLIEMGYGK